MATATRSKDHDLLVRIDERTEATMETLKSFMVKFETHEKDNDKQFESLKKWRAYITGAVSVVGSLGLGSVVYAAFLK